jgi:hypothetical protein
VTPGVVECSGALRLQLVEVGGQVLEVHGASVFRFE